MRTNKLRKAAGTTAIRRQDATVEQEPAWRVLAMLLSLGVAGFALLVCMSQMEQRMLYELCDRLTPIAHVFK